MTIEQTKRIIEVEQAFVDGEEIEENWGACWYLTTNPSWEWQRCKYRVKPTPIEGWVNVYSEGPGSAFHKSKREAIRCAGLSYIRTVKVREVEE